jgi:hypothetical protein
MRKFWIAAVAAVLLVAAANHLEREWRFRRAAREGARTRPGPLLPVREEDGPGGHVDLVLDEAALSLPGEERFRFFDLEAWAWDPVRKIAPPPALARLKGRKVAAAGFMRPDGRAEAAAAFFLVPAGRSEGLEGHEEHEAVEMPGLNHRLFVRLPSPVPVAHGRPVLARGKLFLEPRTEEGYLVRMEAESIEAAGDPVPSLSAAEAARLPRLDFFGLEDLAFHDAHGMEIKIPRELEALEGQRVVAEGYPTERNPEPPPTFLLGKDPWDGCCGGTQPTHFTAVLVGPAAGEPMPPPWTPKSAWAGTLRLTRDPQKWTADGIVRLEDARSCPVLGDLDLLLPFWIELLILAPVLLVPAVPLFLRPVPGEAPAEEGKAGGEGKR